MSDRSDELMEELVAWTRFAHRQGYVASLASVLRDERHLRAFEATDGTRTQIDVAKAAALSQAAISGLWARWRRMGLIIETVGGRPRHLAKPSDLGIDAPET